MIYAEEAVLAQRAGDRALTSRMFRMAFRLERAAAELIADDLTAEPSRSVLLRSAASLALDCGENSEANRLINLALSGNPPAEIAEELHALQRAAGTPTGPAGPAGE